MEGILEVEAGLQIQSLLNAKVLLHGRHRIVGRRSGQDIPSGIARRERRRRSESRDIAGRKLTAGVCCGLSAGRMDQRILPGLVEAIRSNVGSAYGVPNCANARSKRSPSDVRL